MASLEHSNVDWTALTAAAEEWQGLRDALSETAGEIAAAARAHVAASHHRYHGLPYSVSTKIYSTGGMPRAVIRGPLGAFLGVKSPLGRRQTRAYGHPVLLYHPADDYVLRESASVYESTSLYEG